MNISYTIDVAPRHSNFFRMQSFVSGFLEVNTSLRMEGGIMETGSARGIAKNKILSLRFPGKIRRVIFFMWLTPFHRNGNMLLQPEITIRILHLSVNTFF